MKLMLPFSMILFNPKMSYLKMITILSTMWTVILMNSTNYPNTDSLFFIDQMATIMVSLSLLSALLITLSVYPMNSQYLIIMITLPLILAFSVSSTILFYIFFEIVLIPTMILITKLGGQPERLQAAMYLILYTVTASLPFLVGITMLNTDKIMFNATMLTHTLSFPMIFILVFLAKMPMFFLHLWLPKAHVEAPLEGSMILAAVILKLGGYGLIRFLPLISLNLAHLPLWLISTSLWGALSTSMNCTRQKDLKALIAYSSVAHMAMVVASLMTLNHTALHGAIIMMISHGISSSALFFMVNLIYLKFHTRNIISFKGVLTTHPNLIFWWFIFTAMNISAPPSMALMSEILMLTGLMSWNLSILPLFALISLATTSFSILLYITLSHNKTNLTPTNNSSPMFFLGLFLHLITNILLILKLELFMI